jgi:hypothetical protein
LVVAHIELNSETHRKRCRSRAPAAANTRWNRLASMRTRGFLARKTRRSRGGNGRRGKRAKYDQCFSARGCFAATRRARIGPNCARNRIGQLRDQAVVATDARPHRRSHRGGIERGSLISSRRPRSTEGSAVGRDRASLASESDWGGGWWGREKGQRASVSTQGHPKRHSLSRCVERPSSGPRAELPV